MLKREREWGAESNGKLPHLLIPSKTAALVPALAVKNLPLGQNTLMMMSIDLIPVYVEKQNTRSKIYFHLVPHNLNTPIDSQHISFSVIYILPQCSTYTSRTYIPNVCNGSNKNSRRYTRAGLPECVVSTMSGPPPETTQNRTQTKNTHSVP